MAEVAEEEAADVEVAVVVATEQIPKHFLLQWHITECCNLRCRHCYQEQFQRNELSFDKLLTIFEQFKNFITTLEQSVQSKITAHITVTGGEPFIRKDFFDLLTLFYEHRHLLSFSILTNGSFIDEQCAKNLRKLSPRFVQVSLEGGEQTHNHIRGKNHFQETIIAIKNLHKQQITTLISFTAHRGNYKEFPQVAEIGRRLKVKRIWADRLIPQGGGANLQIMNPQETLQFFQIMAQTKRQFQKRWFNCTEIAMHRALQFLAGGTVYCCSAGNSLLTIQPNGDVYPCRRMPIKIGNLFDAPLFEIYKQHFLLQQLRATKISKGCTSCCYQRHCRGGLKCLSYALNGDPFQADPGCWLKTNT